jgi:hypothetical protein
VLRRVAVLDKVQPSESEAVPQLCQAVDHAAAITAGSQWLPQTMARRAQAGQ